MDKGTALDLITAASQACGTAPGDPDGKRTWLTQVSALAMDLYALADTLTERLATVESAVRFKGHITDVRLVQRGSSQKAEVTYSALSGDDVGKVETITTSFIGEPEGDAVYAQAKALIGRDALLGKVHDIGDDRRKYKRLVLVQPVGGGAAQPSPAQSVAEPAVESVTDGPEPVELAGEHEAPVRQNEPATEPPALTPVGTGDETPSLTELRNLEPNAPADVMKWARIYLGLTKEDVVLAVEEVLGPANDKPRTKVQLRKLWNSLLTKHAVSAAA